MLVLSRKQNESMQIDSRIQVTVISIGKSRVKLGITAPGDVSIIREELINRESGSAATHNEALLQHVGS
jgi:carbon storage regulator